jgi:UDPglucose--hexose-1-phosphate uridylyltransferase
LTEFRKDITTNEWVIMARERVKRPIDFEISKNKKIVKNYIDDCPFCLGNERLTPPAIKIYKDNSKSSIWKIRVIPNMFPAVSSEEGLESNLINNYFETISGYGFHKVIIESPFHDVTFTSMDYSELKSIIYSYRDMYKILSKKPVKYIMIFKNHGASAGASIDHIHSQIIAIPIISEHLKRKFEIASNCFNRLNICIYCSMIKKELELEKRIIFKNDGFVAFHPYASLYPFEVWILPRYHKASFGNIEDVEVEEFAKILQEVLSKIDRALGQPDFNYFIETAPIDKEISNYLHWYLRIIPRIWNIGGFELGSGIYINTHIPEITAEYLRIK